MKKSIIIIAAFFCLKGFSQSSMLVTNVASSTTVAPNAIVNAATSGGATTELDFDIRNTSASTKSYNVKRYDITLHAATSTSAVAHFCFAGNCYTEFTTQAGPLSLNAGQSASQLSAQYSILTTDLDEAATAGISTVKYTFINAANASDSLQFTIKYNAPSGVSELSNMLSSLEIFPNPATDATVLKVTSQKAMDAKMIVFNALGAIVSERTVGISEGKNKIDMNINDLPSGVYFAQIKMANSSVTKKLVVK